MKTQESTKEQALAAHLECEADDVTETTWGAFEAEGQEWLVLTEEEADEAWDAALESYIDECIEPELPEPLGRYFDREAWKRDARHDGRGHALSVYDGEEWDSEGFVLFRTN